MSRELLKLEGFKEFEEAMTELPKATARNVAVRVLSAAATPIAEDFASRVKVLTGALKRGIGVGTKLSGRQARLARREGKSGAEVYAGAAPDPAAHLEEFGSSDTPARPALRPAWDAGWRGALEAIKSGLALQIEKARVRLARKAARIAAKNGA